MWAFDSFDRLIVWSNVMAPILADLMLYSTIIGGIGLLGARLLKKRGAVYQSVFLRLSLLAILITPMAALVLSSFDVMGIRLPMAQVKRPDTIRVFAAPNASAPVQKNLTFKQPAPQEPVRTNDTPIRGKDLQNRKTSQASSTDIGAAASNPDDSHMKKESPLSSPGGNSISPGKVKEINKPGMFAALFPFLYVTISLVWILVSLILLLKAVFHNLYIKYLLLTAYDANPAHVKTCRALAEELHVKPPRVLQSPRVKRSFLAGFFSPTIVLPLHENEVSMSSREVFLHEFAHMIRRDHLWNLVCQMGKIILPLQPLMWLLAREIEVTSEYVCDDYVVVYGKSNKKYAFQLYSMAKMLQAERREVSAGVGIFSVRSYLLKRIERILDQSHSRFLTLKFHEMLSFIVLFLSFVVLTGFISFKGEALKRKAMNGNSYSRGNTHSLSLTNKTQENQPSSADFKSVSEKSATPTGVTSRENQKENAVSPKTENLSEDASSPYDILVQSDSPVVSNPFLALLTTEPNSDTQAAPVTNTPAASVPELKLESAADVSVPTGRTDGKSSNETKEHLGSHNALVKPEPIEMKINPGIAANIIPAGIKSEQFASVVTLTQNFRSLTPLDMRARTLQYTSASASQLDPVWSPDGKSIAFTDGQYGVWVVPAEGGEPVLVYDNYYKSSWHGIKFHSVGSMDTFGFTPDGQKLLFQYFLIDENRGTKVTMERDKYGSVTIYQIDGLVPVIMSVDIKTGTIAAVRQEAEKGQYSHNGRYLAFINYDHRYFTDPNESFHMQDLTVQDTGTGEIRYLTYGQYRIQNFCFAPDGVSVLAYMTPRDGSSSAGIYRIPLKGGKAEKLPVSLAGESGGNLQCSPDGRWIIYSEKRSDQHTIVYYDVLTGAERRKTLPAATKGVSLSPDGTKFCSVMDTGISEPVFKLFLSGSLNMPAGVQTIAPVGFAIRGNYPNPFNQSTVIEYTLPESGEVTLEIYNVLGQKVRRLVSETIQPGRHTARWDGRTDKGLTVSTGTYIMRLSMGKFVVTKNIMVLK
ncbi:MAG: M56 family metallopeptidase [Candidatus Latescibacter sp.]|nr:M56 family metallopeptidase [Candidatus Latescibacter sp.]